MYVRTGMLSPGGPGISFKGDMIINKTAGVTTVSDD